MSYRRLWRATTRWIFDSASDLKSRLEDWSTVITLLSTVAVALFTYFLVEAGERQHLDMLESLRQTEDALIETRDGNDIAREALAQSRKSNEDAARMMRFEYGAEVGVISINADARPQGGKPFDIKYQVKNSGRSDARNFTHLCTDWVIPAALGPPENRLPEALPDGFSDSHEPLSAGVTMVFECSSRILDVAQVEQITNGKLKLMFTVIMMYSDPFQEGFVKVRCLEYSPTATTGSRIINCRKKPRAAQEKEN